MAIKCTLAMRQWFCHGIFYSHGARFGKRTLQDNGMVPDNETQCLDHRNVWILGHCLMAVGYCLTMRHSVWITGMCEYLDTA